MAVAEVLDRSAPETLEAAKTYLRAGRFIEAEQCCRQLLRERPDHPHALYTLGRVHQEAGRAYIAIALMRKALLGAPDEPTFHNGLGIALLRWGHFVEAEACIRRAITLDPLSPKAHLNLGLVFMEEGKEADAAASFRRALELDPTVVRAHLGLGIALHLQGQEEAAERSLRRVIELDAHDVNAYQNLGGTLLAQGNFDAAIDSFRRSLEVMPDNAAGHSNLLFVLHFVPTVDRAMHLAEAKAWAARHADALLPRDCTYPNEPDPERRLRIGYVSADLHRHPVGYFLEPILRAHDKARVEVFCYHNCSVNDELTARLRAAADQWRNIVGVTDEAVAQMIRQDAIDVLVDLAGHTGGNRLQAFARKPAPVQATWLGYFDTTGMHAMDYILLDRHLCPPGDERNYVEEVVRLPDDFLCYAPQADVAVGPLPALRTGHVTFACFNKIEKVGPAVVALWADILRRVPTARLQLKATPLSESPGIVRRYERLFGEQGIAPERVSFAGRSQFADYLAGYNQVDIALDPFPFNGGTTTIEALWMGVPVITVEGDSFVSRMGVSHLSTAGLPDLIAPSPSEYVDKAAALAADLPRLASLRAGLRARLLASPLCDGQHFTRGLEAAYRQIWQHWCRGRRQVGSEANG